MPSVTALKYQGYLVADGQVVNGDYDLEFALFDAAEEGTVLATDRQPKVDVIQGRFTTVIEFPIYPDAFASGRRFLEISLKPHDSQDDYQRLSPRQPLRPVPAATFSSFAAEAATSQLAAEVLPGAVTADSILDASITDAKIAPGTLVRSVNGLTDAVSFHAGENVTLTTVPGGLQIDAIPPEPAPTRAGHTLFVDALHGDDTTALRERPDRPWQTLSNALMAVQDNDRMVIRPGLYSMERLGMPENVGDYATASQLAPLRLVNRRNVTIEGYGATIFASGLGSVLSMIDCTNVTVQGIHFLGSGANPPIDGQIAGEIVLWGTNANLTFNQCRIENFPNHGIVVSQKEKTSFNTTVRDCFFQSGGTLQHGTLGLDGAAIASLGPGMKVVGCTFIDVLRCVEIEATYATQPIGPVIIANNVMRDFWSAGVVILPVQGKHTLFNDISITGNTIHGDRQILPGAVNQAGIWAGGGTRITIQGNNVGRCANVGISLTTTMAALSDVVIANNVCWENGDRNIAFVDTHNRGASNAIITGNLSRRNGQYANIQVSGVDIAVTANTLVDSAGRAIYVGSSSAHMTRDVVVSSNRIRRTHWHPIGVGANAYDTIILNNAYSGDYFGLDDSGIQTIKDQAYIGHSRSPEVTGSLTLTTADTSDFGSEEYFTRDDFERAH